MAVVVNMGLTQVLVLRVLMRQMRVRERSVVVLMLVQRGQVLPLSHQFVRSLAPVVSDMWVPVGVDDGLMAVLDVVGQMGSLADLVNNAPRWRQGPGGQEGAISDKAQEGGNLDCSLHVITPPVSGLRLAETKRSPPETGI